MDNNNDKTIRQRLSEFYRKYNFDNDVNSFSDEEFMLTFLEKFDEIMKQNNELLMKNEELDFEISDKISEIKQLKKNSSLNECFEKIEELEKKNLTQSYEIKDKDKIIEELREKKLQIIDKQLKKENTNLKLENVRLKDDKKKYRDQYLNFKSKTKSDAEKRQNKFDKDMDELKNDNRKLLKIHREISIENEHLRENQINNSLNDDESKNEDINMIRRRISIPKDSGYDIYDKIWNFPNLNLSGIMINKIILESSKEKIRIKQIEKIRNILSIYFMYDIKNKIQLTEIKIIMNFFLSTCGIIPLSICGNDHDVIVEEIKNNYLIKTINGKLFVKNIKFKEEYKIIQGIDAF